MKKRVKQILSVLLSSAMMMQIPGSLVSAGYTGGSGTGSPAVQEVRVLEDAGELQGLLVGNTEITGSNVVRGKTIIASSITNNCGPELAVDGNTSGGQWNSANMKNFQASDQSRDTENQTGQWLQIDRGADAQPVDVQAMKLWYNVKVWPMEYKILTASSSSLTANTPAADISLEDWTELVSVSRPSNGSGNGWVANGDGQNIADNAANTDTITGSTTPGLADQKLQRYVLIYFSKVNTQAGGHNVNLREIEIFDTSVDVNVQSIVNGITAEQAVIADGRITFPQAEQAGVTISVRGSTLENVVANDGTVIGKNIGPREVTLIVRAAKTSNESEYAEKNLTVVIPDYSSSYDSSLGLTQASVNREPEVIPSLQEWHGGSGDFQLTEATRIIYSDPASVGVKKVAEHMQADLKEITGLDLEVSEGEGPSSAHDIYIQSQTEDSYGVGEEGYFLVNDEEGLSIYAPTYTGCLYGTITVEQILYQNTESLKVPRGVIRDYPAYEVRGVMLDIARTPYRFQQLKDYTKIMLWYKMNEFHMHVNDNDNCNTNFADESTHMGFHRLESETFPSLVSEVKQAGPTANLLNPDYYLNNPDYQGNPHYSKEQWRELKALCEDSGMYLLTEIDLPGHSLLYNKYAKENPDQIDWLEGGVHYTNNRLGNSKGGLELMELSGTNAERAKRFAETLWNEYTEGEDPFIDEDIVHIGADEYWDHDNSLKNPFALFADRMRQVIQGNLGEDTKIRMWGAGTSMFSTAATALPGVDLQANYQLDLWHTSYENPRLRLQEGYEVVNCRDAFVYGNPGRDNRDVPNAEYLFNSWTPADFGGNNPLQGAPGLLGSKAVFWGDQSVAGMTEADVHQRVLRGIAILSEKTWDGTNAEDTFQEYEMRASRLAEGPGTEIAMNIDSRSTLVLDYDFQNISEDGKTIYDISGNGYNGTLSKAGTVSEDGFLSLDGDALTTPLKTVSYPYTVVFDLKIDAQDAAKNTTESSLFSGYDGQIQAAGNENGDLLANVNYFTRNFNYQIPQDGTKVQIMLVGTFQGTKLYVNGAPRTFLSWHSYVNGLSPNSMTTIASSVLLPLEKIGEGLHGEMARLQVYEKAFSAEEAKAYFDGGSQDVSRKVNVAQNTHAGGDSYHSGDAQDNSEQRISVAFKAIDGDAFTLKADVSTQMDESTSERASYWKGDHNDDSLCVDLGTMRSVSEVQIHWRYGSKGRNFDIMTSSDGEHYTLAKAVTDNNDFVTTVTLPDPVDARFVKVVCKTSNGNGYKIQELLILEQVDKSELDEILTQAEVLAEEKGLNIGAEYAEEEQMLLEALIWGRSVRGNMLADMEDVASAVAELQQAVEANGTTDPEPEPEPVSYTIQIQDTANGSVRSNKETAQAEEEVILTVAAKDGYELESLLVMDGEEQEVQVTEEASGQYSFIMPESDVTITAVFEKVEAPEPAVWPYTDVDVAPGQWKYDSVKFVTDRGVMGAITNTTLFQPDRFLSRAMFATVLYRMAGEPKVSGKNNFSDVEEDKWYTDAVIWANQNQIVQGIGDGKFGRDDDITREQIAKMLYVYAEKVCKYDVSVSKDLSEFTDVKELSAWSVGYMKWAVGTGMISGKPNDEGRTSFRLDGKGEATRAECAAMLKRFAERYEVIR